jgi:3-phenylpropionate/trans-cinnamate dioxygenase ferredoxin subunit
VTNFVEVAKASELTGGTMKKVLAQEHEILLARVGDKYYAAESRCPHLGADLSQGKLEGTIVTCPRHASQFDLADGRIIRWTDWSGLLLKLGKTFRSPRPLNVYNAKVEDEMIMVKI